MVKVNRTYKSDKFFRFINSQESRNTELSRAKSCLDSVTRDEHKETRVRMQARKDMDLGDNYLEL